MGRVKHKTTKRGNHKHRAWLHESYMIGAHPAIWSWMRAVEYHQAMDREKIITLEMGTEPYNVNHIMEA